jgi:membrane associated rhomboid family serine protease
MIPIGSDESDLRARPIVTYLLIAANVFIFLFLQKFGADRRFTYAYSMVPYEFLTGHDLVTLDGYLVDVTDREVLGQLVVDLPLAPSPHPVYITLLTSLFLHGSFMHLAGNMLFLWVFGKHLEDTLGGFRFLLFYVIAGVSASLVHVFFNQTEPDSLIPTLGASGAISGVMAGYLMLFPHKMITVLVYFFAVELPAFVVIGLWFVFQIINYWGTFGDPTGGGIAYAAHIGGFLVGLALIVPLSTGRHHEDPYYRHYR